MDNSGILSLFSTLDGWTAISAIATGLMAIATFITLVQNRHQLKELKRQWEDEHKARLIFSIVVINDHWYCLRIENAGRAIAEDITFTINEEFVGKLLLNGSRENLRSFAHNPITILPGQYKQFMISPICGTYYNAESQGQKYTSDQVDAQLDEIMNIPIRITGYYNNKEVIAEEFAMDDFFRHSIVEKDKVVVQLERIAEMLKP